MPDGVQFDEPAQWAICQLDFLLEARQVLFPLGSSSGPSAKCLIFDDRLMLCLQVLASLGVQFGGIQYLHKTLHHSGNEPSVFEVLCLQ